MKNCFLAMALASLATLAHGQTPEPPALRNQLSLGPVLGTLKLKDLQASPLLYVANPKGAQLAFTHRSAAARLRVELQAGTSRFIAPAVGLRTFTFSDQSITGETTSGTMVLVPTLYQGTLDISYIRRLNRTNARNKWRSYGGVSLHNGLAYADGVAMTTWGINQATLNAVGAGEWQVGRRHLLSLQAALPLAGLVSRMPYSNVLSRPHESEFGMFFRQGTRLATWNQLQRLQVQGGYHYALRQHLALGVQYQGEWFHYRRPRSVWALSHQGAVQAIYCF